jgi:predicted amidohydrolase
MTYLEAAARAHCDIAVFPEMSLTGSVDPRTHPEDAITLEHDSIDVLTHATGFAGPTDSGQQVVAWGEPGRGACPPPV